MNTFDFCILIKNKIYNFSFKLKKIILYLLIFKIDWTKSNNEYETKITFSEKIRVIFLS